MFFALIHTFGEQSEKDFPGMEFDEIVREYTDKGYSIVQSDFEFAILKSDHDGDGITVEIMRDDAINELN